MNLAGKLIFSVYFLGTLFIASDKSAQAELIFFECSEEGLSIKVDTNRGIITFSDGSEYTARITPQYVIYPRSIKRGEYYHRFNRTTGLMSIQGYDGVWVDKYACPPTGTNTAITPGPGTAVRPGSNQCRSLAGTWIYRGPWSSQPVEIIIKADGKIYYRSGEYLGAYECENNSYALQWQGNGPLYDLSVSADGRRMSKTFLLEGTHVFTRR